jgi:hypothetical protein
MFWQCLWAGALWVWAAPAGSGQDWVVFPRAGVIMI